MRSSLLIGCVTAATLAGGIAAAQAPSPQTTRVPITTATVAPRPTRVAPAAREIAPPTAADAQGGPYAVMDEGAAPATAAYPVASAPARPVRVAAVSQRTAASAAQEPYGEEGAASAPTPPPAPRETAAQKRAAQAAQAAQAQNLEAMNGRMGKLLHDSMTSLFEASPQMARATGIRMQKLANGVSISYVSDDPAVIERLQKMAEAMRLMKEASAE